MRNLRGSKDREIERRDNSRQATPRTAIPTSSRPHAQANRADGTQNRNNNRESDLAAYPQSFGKRDFHSLNRSPFFVRPK